MTLIALLTLTNLAFADDKSENDPIVVYKKETVIDFEGLEIEGELVKPQGNLILERSQALFNPLIRLRKDFSQEMTQSVNDVQ
jgi:RNase P/RNase MRP subunit p29